MSGVSAEQAAVAERLSAAVANLDSTTQKAVLDAVVPPPTGNAINQLWLIVVIGLSATLLVALIGGIVLAIDGKTTEVAVTAFTALLVSRWISSL